VIPPRTATRAQSVLEIMKAKTEATGRSVIITEGLLSTKVPEGRRPCQSMGLYGDPEGAAAPTPPRPKGLGESSAGHASPREAPIVSKFKSMLPKW
jgi:hypothetical protein